MSGKKKGIYWDFMRRMDRDTKIKWRSIGLLVLCEVMALALWFSASAVIPALKAEYHIGSAHSSLFTSSVALGFVAGTLVSAVLGLADRMHPVKFFMISSWAAALINAAILLFEPTSLFVIILRFLTGACMAGIYPVGMKMVATWSRGDTGLLVGLLVGALTLGSASPHLFNAAGEINWRFTLIAASLSAAIAGTLIRFFLLGPNHIQAPPFKPSAVFRAWTDKPLRLANLGYFGHMWELYAMWGWVGLFFHASFGLRIHEGGASVGIYSSLATFAVIGAGSVGCLLGGLFADRLGRTTLTMGSMAVSGLCAIGAGFLFGGNPWALTALCLIWGFAVVADSAQFSSCVIELSDPSYVGTMLTVQTSVGFLLTLVTIHLIPFLVEMVGWRYAFASLAIGPFLGIISMGRLRAHPSALMLASGNR